MTEKARELLSLRMEMVDDSSMPTVDDNHTTTVDDNHTTTMDDASISTLSNHLREMECLLDSQRPSYVKVGYARFCEMDRLPIGSLLV